MAVARARVRTAGTDADGGRLDAGGECADRGDTFGVNGTAAVAANAADAAQPCTARAVLTARARR